MAAAPTDAQRQQRCSAGVADACNSLAADLLLRPNPSKSAVVLAFDLYLKACNNKHAIACGNLGAEYYNGTYVAADSYKAMYFNKKACDMGDEVSCKNVRDMKEENYQARVAACKRSAQDNIGLGNPDGGASTCWIN